MIRLRNRGHAADWELLALVDECDDIGWDVSGHVARCADCARRLEQQRAETYRVREIFWSLGSPEQRDYASEIAELKRRIAEERLMARTGGGNRMVAFWGHRMARLAVAAAVLVVMVGSLSFTPMRTVAEDLLRQMRVREFAAVTIPMDMVKPFESAMLESMTEEDRQRLHDEFARLGTFETTFNVDLEHLPWTMTVDEARSTYGDFVTPESLPDGFGEPEAFVTEAGTASYTLNVEQARQLIGELNIPIYSLPDPEQYPTLTFTASFPAAVVLHYTSTEQEHLVVGQMVSPTLDIPEGIDMDMVREDVLRFPGLPADLVAQLRAIEDWEETLIIPVPEGARTDNVTIDGEPALLIETEQGSAILWEKDGLLHAVAGQVSAGEARDIAASLK